MKDGNKKEINKSYKISELIKEKLKDYLENIDFRMRFSNSNFVFYVQDVEIRNDLLKKLGIPLELTKGKVQEIKLTVLFKFNTGSKHNLTKTFISRNHRRRYRHTYNIPIPRL
jgi:hypothetical protein